MIKLVRSVKPLLLQPVFIVTSMTVALAQAVNPAASPGNDFLRKQAGEALEQRLDALEESTPDVKQVTPSIPQVEPQAVIKHGIRTPFEGLSASKRDPLFKG